MIEMYVVTTMEQVKRMRNLHKGVTIYAVNSNGVYNGADITKLKLSVENQLKEKGSSKLCVLGYSENIQRQIEEMRVKYQQRLELFICHGNNSKLDVGNEKNIPKHNTSNAKFYFNRIDQLHFIDI